MPHKKHLLIPHFRVDSVSLTFFGEVLEFAPCNLYGASSYMERENEHGAILGSSLPKGFGNPVATIRSVCTANGTPLEISLHKHERFFATAHLGCLCLLARIVCGCLALQAVTH